MKHIFRTANERSNRRKILAVSTQLKQLRNNTVPTFALIISLDGGNSGNCTDSEACTYFSDYNKCSN